MGTKTLVLRRASGGSFDDAYLQTIASLVKYHYNNADLTLQKALDDRLPEVVTSVPTTLTAGKLITVSGVVYAGDASNKPVKVTYSHPTGSGNKHLPAGGTKGQYLTNSDGAGGGAWTTLPSASTSASGTVQLNDAVNSTSTTQAATANAVKKAYDKANHSHPYINTDKIGAKSGVAPLDENGTVPSSYLPSYVDDVIDGTISDDLTTFTDTDKNTVTPEAGKIYNDVNKNKSYRWSGTAYVSLNDGVALGTTGSTAFYGDKGQTAYEHSQSTHARTDATKTEKSSTNGSVKINGSDVVVYTHPTTAGNKHLPSGGSANQYIKYSAAGTGAWQSPDTTPTANSNNLITSGAVASMKSTLESSIAGKANSDHTHTKADIGLGNVDNKSSATIRSELTAANVTKGLGYTPAHDTDMTGPTTDAAGTHGLVPAPAVGDGEKYLRGDGSWATPKDTTYADATTTVHGLLSTDDKAKLDGIAKNANNYSHPSHTAATEGLYKVTVDALGHVTKTTKVVKSDITGLGIPSTNTTYSEATSTAAGLLSADDKAKLDGIADNANKYTHPSYTSKSSGLYKITVDATGHVSAATAVAKSDITGLGIPGTNTTYSAVTDSANGLMTSDMKKKLDGIDENANKTVVSTSIAQNDTNPVSGGAVWSALGNKANASSLSGKQDKLAGTAGQYVGFDESGAAVAVDPDITKSSADAAYVAKTGGTMSGDLTTTNVTLTSITDLGAGVSNFAVVNSSGKIYKRSKASVISDLGVATKASPALTGTPTTPTPASNAGDTQIANVKYVKDAVGALLGQKDALVFMGTITIGGTLPAADAGHVYRVIASDTASKGTISTLTVCAGDTITCFADSTAADTPANWFTTHTNQDGMISGPSSSTANHVVTFSDTSGKNVKDSGFTIGKSVPSDAKFTDTVYTHPSYTAKSSGLYKITVDATGHVSAVTDVAKSDITGLGIPASDTKYTHPTYTAKNSGLYKITVDSTGHVSAATAVAKSDITGLGIPASDTVYTHPSSGVTADSYGPSANATPAYGATFNVPYLTVDANGHVTAASSKTVKIPAAPTSVSGNAGTATKLKTARTITLSGDVSGSASFDGSANVTITTTSNISVPAESFSSTQPTDQKTGDYWYEPISAVN